MFTLYTACNHVKSSVAIVNLSCYCESQLFIEPLSIYIKTVKYTQNLKSLLLYFLDKGTSILIG